MRRALVISLLAAGCFDDRYTCTTDADCNLGEAGRCEVDHLCTTYDKSCPTERRYTVHSGGHSNKCFDDRVELANPCAPDQQPPLPTGCAASVCDVLPSCCATGWTEACVQLAESETTCALHCDTRIAITATRGTLALELWEADWNTTDWSGHQDSGASGHSWIGPAPGGTAPRHVRIDPLGTALQVDDAMVMLGSDHRALTVASVDFDRDGRDTIALGWLDSQQTNNIEIVKLDTGDVRELGDQDSSQLLSWGEWDRDGFPDVAGAFNARFDFDANAAGDSDPEHRRVLNNVVRRSMPGSGLGNLVPGVRTIDWVDLDNDGRLDLVAIGNAVRIHLGTNVLEPLQSASIDCDPPSLGNCGAQDDTLVTHAGTAVSSATQSSIVFATENDSGPTATPNRPVYRVTAAGIFAATLAYDQLTFATACGNPCQPIHAIVARDLDGDHVLDLIAIDAQLQIYVALSTVDPRTFVALPTQPIHTTNDPARPFTAVRVSVTGVVH